MLLLQQFSLGVQALTKKYQQFKYQDLLLAINENVQCRVWLSSDLSQFWAIPPQQNYTDKDVILFLIGSVLNRSSSRCQRFLSEMTYAIKSMASLSFKNFLELLGQKITEQRIVLPSRIEILSTSSKILRVPQYESP